MADFLSGSSGLELPTNGELVFDDDSAEEAIYGQPGQGPTPASLFQAVRRVLNQMAGGHSEEDILLSTADLALSGQPIAPVAYRTLARMLTLLARRHCDFPAFRADPAPLLGRLLELAREHRDTVLLTIAGVSLALLRQLSGLQEAATSLWQELGEAQRQASDEEDQFVDLLEHCTWASWPALCAILRCQGVLQLLQHLQSLVPVTPNATMSVRAGLANAFSPVLQPCSYLSLVQPALERIVVTIGGTKRASWERRCVAVAALEIMAGPGHPFTASCLNMLIRVLQIAGEHQAAKVLSLIAVEIRSRALAPTHPLLSTSYNNLGLSLVCLGELDEAERALIRAVELLPNNPYPLYWLGRLYQQRGRPGDIVLEARAWRRYLQLKGTSADRIREAQARLEQLPAH